MKGAGESAHPASACIACGTRDSRQRREFSVRLALNEGEHVRQCRHCGLGWLERQSSAPAVYGDDYFEGYSAQGGMPAGIDQVPVHVISRLTELERHLGKAGTLLDVGCGFGRVLGAARERGWTVTGTDISQWSAEHVRRTLGLEVVVGDILEVDLPAESYDVIHASHSLEHMTAPLEALSRMRSWLKPEGLLVLEVPNQLEEMYANIRWALLRRYVEPPVGNSHEFFFSPGSVPCLLSRAGYHCFRLWSERRNVDTESRFPLGRIAKRWVFALEERTCRGPNLVAWAAASRSAHGERPSGRRHGSTGEAIERDRPQEQAE